MELAKLCLELEYSILEQRVDQVECIFNSFNFKTDNSGLLGDVKQLALHLCQGDYVNVLQCPIAAELLGSKISVDPSSTQEIDEYFKERSLKFLNSSQADLDDKTLSLRQMANMFTGIACLQLFVQHNWTGPPPTATASEFMPLYYREMNEEKFHQMAINSLNRDGQCIYKLVQQPTYLLLANVFLVQGQKELTYLKTSYVWAIRCLSVKQQLMEEHSNDVMNQTLDLINKVHDDTSLLSAESKRQICCELLFELGHLCLYYWDIAKAKNYFSTAEEYLGLKLNLTGALGKRTKFQENFIAQLRVDVSRNDENDRETPSPQPSPSDLPTNVALNDDTVLENIKFKEGEKSDKGVELTSLEQASVLATCILSQKSQAVEKLTTEELLAYIESVVKQPTAWATQSMALLMRSKLEKGRSRKAERSMMQLEALVNSVKQPNPKAKLRHALFYCLPLQPKWEIERELARALVTLGAVKSALEVFERLEMWEDVITCYQTLGWHEKAEKLVRQQLETGETAILWCLLGDITKDASYYEKAWEVSNHRSSRAQRSLGLHHLRAVRYSECIPCFQKSLQINSLQDGLWFSLGCAAMATGENELASKAFHRCVSLDSSNGEAWNNLANVCLKLNNKHKAHVALQEAMRSNYDNWHIWDNFLVVSTDIGAFRDAIRAYHRLMDLRDKFKDVEILKILVKAVNQGILDNNDMPASQLKPELFKLMGRITSQITNDSTIWRLYSDLYMTEESADGKEKALGFLVKAHRSLIQDPSCENDMVKFKKAIEMTLTLAELYEEVSATKSDNTQAIQLLSSAKLTVKQLVTKAKKQHTDPMTGGVTDDLAGGVTELDSKLQCIIDKIAALKS